MKVCPVCKARVFDDMEQCFGCLHRFEGEGAVLAPEEQVRLSEPAVRKPHEEQIGEEAHIRRAGHAAALQSTQPSAERPACDKAAPAANERRAERPYAEGSAPVAEALVVPDPEGGASIRIEIRLSGLEACMQKHPQRASASAGAS